MARALLLFLPQEQEANTPPQQASDHSPAQAGLFFSGLRQRMPEKNKAAVRPPWKVAPIPSGWEPGGEPGKARRTVVQALRQRITRNSSMSAACASLAAL